MAHAVQSRLAGCTHRIDGAVMAPQLADECPTGNIPDEDLQGNRERGTSKQRKNDFEPSKVCHGLKSQAQPQPHSPQPSEPTRNETFILPESGRLPYQPSTLPPVSSPVAPRSCVRLSKLSCYYLLLQPVHALHQFIPPALVLQAPTFLTVAPCISPPPLPSGIHLT